MIMIGRLKKGEIPYLCSEFLEHCMVIKFEFWIKEN